MSSWIICRMEFKQYRSSVYWGNCIDHPFSRRYFSDVNRSEKNKHRHQPNPPEESSACASCCRIWSKCWDKTIWVVIPFSVRAGQQVCNRSARLQWKWRLIFSSEISVGKKERTDHGRAVLKRTRHEGQTQGMKNYWGIPHLHWRAFSMR